MAVSANRLELLQIADAVARETASQSSTAIVPSGRSAMIWTVQPSSPEIFTRTRR